MSDKPYFTSEELEPFAGMIIGKFFARCEWEIEHGDEWSLARECDNFWYAMNAINKISIATNSGDKGAVHFSIASMNEKSKVAKYIEMKTGRKVLEE